MKPLVDINLLRFFAFNFFYFFYYMDENILNMYVYITVCCLVCSTTAEIKYLLVLRYF